MIDEGTAGRHNQWRVIDDERVGNMRIKSAITLALLGAMLTACGGGGDGGDDTSSVTGVQGDSGSRPEPAGSTSSPGPIGTAPGAQTGSGAGSNGASKNTPPTVDAGESRSVVSGGLFTLHATVSDKESPRSSLTVKWEQTAGPVAKNFFSSDNSTSPSYYAPKLTDEPARLTFKITVTDGGGLSASDTVSLTVKPIVTVGGAITTDATWKGDRVYFVDQSLSVRSGATLTVEPGAVVTVHYDDVDFIVQGKLVAKGEADSEGRTIKPVVFTNSDKDNCCDFKWSGIQVIDGGYVELTRVVIEKAITGINLERGAGSLTGMNLYQHNFYAFDAFRYPYSTFRNGQNTYYKNTVAISASMGGGSEIAENYFLENDQVFSSITGSTEPFNIHDNNFVRNKTVVTAQEINDALLPGQANFYNNWWGTTDMDAINRMIKDNRDDPRLMSINPTPASAFIGTSWGTIKAGFDWRKDLP